VVRYKYSKEQTNTKERLKIYVITKWCKAITDSGKDEYTHKSHEGMPFKFRCLDDDGEIYFYGYSSSCDDEKAFAPLDRIGAEYGCTSIEYRNEKGEWEEL